MKIKDYLLDIASLICMILAIIVLYNHYEPQIEESRRIQREIGIEQLRKESEEYLKNK